MLLVLRRQSPVQAERCTQPRVLCRGLNRPLCDILVDQNDDFGECFWPNGKKAPPNWIKCPGQTNCCASGEACLSNSLCYEAHLNIAYRGACSDQDWPPSSCPNLCSKQVSDTWANIFPCPNNTNEQFTCGAPGGWVTEVCNDNMETYVWDTTQQYKVSYAELPEPNSNTTTTSSSSSSATPTPSSSGSLGSQSAGACTPAADEHEKTALAAGLGAGLGVPLFLVSAAFLAFWLRTRKQLQEARATSQGYLNALTSAQHGMVGVPHGGSLYGPVAELSNKGTFAGELDGSEMRAREMEG